MSDLQIIPVDPSRLAWGEFDRQTGRELGDGDVVASYSADTIGAEGRVRKPFQFDGQLWVTVSICQDRAEAYRLVPLQFFNEKPTNYRDKVDIENGDAARADPSGFYHGMAVKRGKQEFALVGPPAVFVAGPVRSDATPSNQMEMFAP